MSNLVVAVGGTGQMVLHYYLQLYLLGVVTEPFTALVVDTDDIMPSIRNTGRFFETLRHGAQPRQALGAVVPSVESIRMAPPSQAANARELLAGVGGNGGTHPAEAFFSAETLEQSLVKGLYARPALSSVLSQRRIWDTLPTPSDASTVVVVGSVIGGTGGGLIAPIVDALYEKAHTGNHAVKLRAVLFGDYFEVDANRIDGGQTRTRSNQNLVLRALGDAYAQLHSYYLVGGPGSNLVDRDPNLEKAAEKLTWPTPAHPYWEGLRALDYLLRDQAMAVQPSFREKEVTHQQLGSDFRVAADGKRNAGVARARALVNRSVVSRLGAEPWGRSVWGDLVVVVAHYWRLAESALGRERTADFLDRLHRALQDIWMDRSDGLAMLFPEPEKYRLRPADFARIPWPDPERATPERRLFEGDGAAADRCAATLLYWTLRGKGA